MLSFHIAVDRSTKTVRRPVDGGLPLGILPDIAPKRVGITGSAISYFIAMIYAIRLRY